VSRAVSPDPISVPALFVNTLLVYFVVAQVVNGLFRLAEWRMERRYRQRRPPSTILLPEATRTIGIPE
jgi:hypothetical protein